MTLNQNINSNSFHQFQKLWERISSLNKVIASVNKELEAIKISINEIDLSELEGSLKHYTDNAVGTIPHPDLSNHLTRSHVYNVPQVDPIPDQNPLKNGSLLVTRSYVDMTVNNSQSNLSNYLTTNDVYVPPVPSDHIVVKVPNPDDNKLITKKYLDSVMPDSFLTINDSAAIADTGHYITGHDVYNHNNEIQPVYYPLSTSGINHDRLKLATQGYVIDLVNANKSR
jgi:hypothetical protein